MTAESPAYDGASIASGTDHTWISWYRRQGADSAWSSLCLYGVGHVVWLKGRSHSGP